MPLLDCPHRPACPVSASRWWCGQRTRVEAAVARGLIAHQAAASLLAKSGVPITPASRVYTGAAPLGPVQARLS